MKSLTATRRSKRRLKSESGDEAEGNFRFITYDELRRLGEQALKDDPTLMERVMKYSESRRKAAASRLKVQAASNLKPSLEKAVKHSQGIANYVKAAAKLILKIDSQLGKGFPYVKSGSLKSPVHTGMAPYESLRMDAIHVYALSPPPKVDGDLTKQILADLKGFVNALGLKGKAKVYKGHAGEGCSFAGRAPSYRNMEVNIVYRPRDGSNKWELVISVNWIGMP